MKYNGIIISDIHFGVMNSDKLQKELNDVFLAYLNTLKSIDFIIITGDYFDHKIYLNEDTSNYALSFMDTLVDISRDHKCPIRLIYGTESHEVNQYNIFSMYENDSHIDFKVIKCVSSEYLLPKLKVLYVPEEYVNNKSEYYKDYFNKEYKYNYVFGHGVIQEVMTQASRSITKTQNTDRKKVPVFNSNELSEICDGEVYFGHYHVNTNIQDKLFYVGSFSRWIHGEEADKGFYHVVYDTKEDIYENKFIINELADKFITYTFAYNDELFKSDNIIDELNKRDKITDIHNIDNVRYIFNIPEDYENPEAIISILNERYRYDDTTKVKIVNGYVEEKKKTNKEKMNTRFNEYGMIFDKNIMLEDKVVYFIKKRNDKDISIENVKRYLYNENI